MFTGNPNAIPGTVNNLIYQPLEVFYAYRERATFLSAPVQLDANNTRYTPNNPYPFVLFPGELFGKVTSNQFYANSVYGLTTGAVTSGSTTITTDANTAAEILRRTTYQGTTTFQLFGPAVTGGTNAATTLTYSSISGTTINLVGTAGVAAVTGSMLQPLDGSQNILTMLTLPWALKNVDSTQVNYIQIFGRGMLARLNGAVLNQSVIQQFSPEPSIQTFVLAALDNPLFNTLAGQI